MDATDASTRTTQRRRPPKSAASFNRFALRISGHRWFPLYGVVEHRGRKSGTPYQVPVAVLSAPGAVVIGLPWGRGTNWAQNVLAAGGCTMRWRGSTHRLTEPRLAGAAEALPLVRPLPRALLRRLGMQDFLVLRR